jgi:hypothetical protein
MDSDKRRVELCREAPRSKTVRHDNLGKFRIRRGEVEVEYEGEDSEKRYSEAFDWLKLMQSEQSREEQEHEPASAREAGSSTVSASNDDSVFFSRVSKDVGIEADRLNKVVALVRPAGFKIDVPRLENHPAASDAVYGIIYLLQVGMAKKEIQVTELKDVVIKANGYSLPFNALGRILESLEGKKHIIRSQTQKRYKPLVLSMPGLERARELVRSWVEH